MIPKYAWIYDKQNHQECQKEIISCKTTNPSLIFMFRFSEKPANFQDRRLKSKGIILTVERRGLRSSCTAH